MTEDPGRQAGGGQQQTERHAARSAPEASRAAPLPGCAAALRPSSRALPLLFLAIGTWTAAVSPFSAVILREHGVDTATIGRLAALAAVAATVLVPAWGHLADVVAGRVAAFRVGIVLAVAAAVALWLPLPPLAFALVIASFGIFPAIFAALGDTLAIASLASPEREYGGLRARSSLSYAVAAIVAGFFYDRAGYGAVPVVLLVWSCALYVILRWVPDATRDAGARAAEAGRGAAANPSGFGSVGRALAVQPRLWAVIAVFTVAYAGLLGAWTFVGIRIVELGGQPSDVALNYGISSFAEIPGLVLAGVIGQRIGVRWLVVVALVGYGLAIASWGILPTPLAINATRVLTGLCFGALIAARVLVVMRLLPPDLQATGQSMLQAATFGFGTAVGAVVGGALYGAVGATVFFGAAGAVAAGGGIAAGAVLRGPVGNRIRPAERPDP